MHQIPEAVIPARGTSRRGCRIIIEGRNSYILNIRHGCEDAEQVALLVLLHVASDNGDGPNCLGDNEYFIGDNLTSDRLMHFAI